MLFAMMLTASTVAQDAWLACLRANLVVYAETQETTEVAALATMGACTTEADRYFASFYRTPFLERMMAGPRGLSEGFREQQREQRKDAEADIRLQTIAKIAIYRANRAKP